MTHLPWHRLEVDTLTDDERAHLDACPRCRVDRRELLASRAEPVPPELFDALRRAREQASDVVPSSWRSGSAGRARALPVQLLPAGSRFGSYEVDALLGTGGMAVVYRARHTELRTLHALKVLAAPGHGLGERLLQEGRLQGRLRHRNIVGVTDVIPVSGTPALVLEYVPGPSLDRVQRNLRLSLGEADALAIDVLTGVAAAHANGFVHRDLKPSNVLVEATGDGAVAKVADFGLARVMVGDDESLHTRTGGMLGTLVYMAPEQVRDPRQADTRSDVFALGALLYELVTGQRCFGGVDMVDIVQRIATATYEPLPGEVPVRMARAIDAALRVDPDARPSSAAELLELWVEGRVEPAHPWSPARLALLADQLELRPLPGAPPAPRFRVASRGGLVAAGVFALLVGSGLAWWSAGTTPDVGAIMLVHDLGGAPGRPPHTSLRAVFAPDLRGVYTAGCVPDGGCAAEVPEPDGWVPLIAGPTMAALTTPVSAVEWGGLEAPPAGAIYMRSGELSGDADTVRIDDTTVALPWRAPTVAGLEGDLARPVRLGPGEGTTIRWAPGGAGTPFLEVRPRNGGNGRLYALRDDGEFTLPPEAFGPAPSQADVVFGRQERADLEVDGRAIAVLARAQEWLTVVRVEPDRIELPGIGNCEETKYRPALGPGRYWGTFDRTDGPAVPTPWACTGSTLAGTNAIHAVLVPASGALGVYGTQPGGDLALWVATNPYCQPIDCIRGVDREGETEALVLTGDGTEKRLNLGIHESVAHGGLYLVDLVALADPSEQRATVSWTPETLEVHVDAPADVELRFGLAETQSPNGWYGEDCLHGNTNPPVAQCHTFVGPDLTLRRIPLAEQTRGGSTTLWWSEIGQGATFYLEAPNVPGPDGAPTCWVWGDAPAYYASQGCTLVE
ncbi:MAG: serine/threonine-protein kinase [Myxococcota bacterium]